MPLPLHAATHSPKGHYRKKAMGLDFSMTPRRRSELWIQEENPISPRWSVLGVTGIFKMDHVGYEIWSLLDGEHTVGQVAAELTSRYPDQSAVRVSEDVAAFIQELADNRLVTLDYLSVSRSIKEALAGRLPPPSTAIEKKRLDVLLLVPPSSSVVSNVIVSGVSSLAPLGLGYIAAMLASHGFSVSILSLTQGPAAVALLTQYLHECQPRLIGFSTMTETINNAIKLASFCKQVDPPVKIAMGGPHATFQAEEILSGNTPVDYVVQREGEHTMVELAEFVCTHRGSLDRLRGIAYKTNGKCVRLAAGPLIKDLDCLPYPVREIITARPISYEYAAVSSSRGCPAHCTFCSAGAMSGGRYRVRSPESTVAEIQYLTGRGYRKFSFVDDTVTPDTQRVLEFCQLLGPMKVVWNAESRVDVIAKDKQLAVEMARCGCEAIQLGVESGSEHILQSIRKGITLLEIERAVQNAREAGLLVACSMMIGLPSDTHETMRATIDFAVKLQEQWGAMVVVAICTPYPGTYIYLHPDKFGARILSENYDDYVVVNPIMETQNFSTNDVRRTYFEALARLHKSVPEVWRLRFKKRIEAVTKEDASLF